MSDPTTDDLTERLRAAALLSETGGGEWYQLIHRCREAADRIDQLEARETKLATILKEAQRWTGSGGECSIVIEEAQDLLREAIE